jgi:hypothetical protein
MSTAGSEAGGHRRRGDQANTQRTPTHEEPNAPVPTIVQYPVKPLKIHAPDTYEGQRGKLKAFLCQLDLFFGFNVDRFPTEKDKVLFATTYLRGPAFEWMEVFLSDFMKNKMKLSEAEIETQEMFHSYATFQEKIKRVFGNADEKRDAERRIEGLSQSTSAAHYASEFQQYAGRVDWNEAALIRQFYRGLKERVKDEVAKDERDDDLQELISRAIKIDNRQHERKLEKKGEYRTHHKPSTNTKSNYYGPQPMELDATRFKGKLSQRDRDYRMKNKLCLYCGKPGHRANECRAKADGPRLTKTDRENKKRYGYVQATQMPKQSKKNKKPSPQVNATEGNPAVVKNPLDESDTKHPMHGAMSWTACYTDYCPTHYGDKQGSGWFPCAPRTKKKPRQQEVWLNATSSINSATCDETTESYHNSDSDGCDWPEEEALSHTRSEDSNPKTQEGYPEENFYNIVKETPPEGSKFTTCGGFVTPNGGFIPRELRRRTWLLKREYRMLDPELNPNLRVDPDDYEYYPTKDGSWKDELAYFEDITVPELESALREDGQNIREEQLYEQTQARLQIDKTFEQDRQDMRDREAEFTKQHQRVLTASHDLFPRPGPGNRKSKN